MLASRYIYLKLSTITTMKSNNILFVALLCIGFVSFTNADPLLRLIYSEEGCAANKLNGLVYAPATSGFICSPSDFNCTFLTEGSIVVDRCVETFDQSLLNNMAVVTYYDADATCGTDSIYKLYAGKLIKNN